MPVPASSSLLIKELIKKNKSLSKEFTPIAPDMDRVACIVLGGGRGTRLFPLTTKRSKPAICFGGRYRLIDIPLSNAINSNISKIFIVTQFLSTSIHRHVSQTYQLGRFFHGFIDLLAAEETLSHHVSYQGTADAVRQNISYFKETAADYFLILSGDQIYNLDFRKMVLFAYKTNADMVIAALPVNANQSKRMGILKTDHDHFVTDFTEKPQKDEQLQKLSTFSGSKPYLGSMGIYLFKREVLFNLLEEDPREDFGRHIIPEMVSRGSVAAYVHDGYWEDIGTIESFYKANIDLTSPTSTVDFSNEEYPIYASKYNLPGPKIENTSIEHSILCEGVRCQAEKISHSILGPRTVVKKNTIIKNSYLMGNDFYSLPVPNPKMPPELEIGKNCLLEGVILDKNVSIGDNVTLTNTQKLRHYDGEGIYIRDGIIIVTKNTHIPSNFTL